MSIGRAEIVAVATGGPVAYTWTVDQIPSKQGTGFATMSAAVDDAKPLIAALPGVFIQATVSAQANASGRAEVVKVVSGGPFAYVWYVNNGASKAAAGLASASAVLDDLKALIGALSGSLVRIVISVTTDG